MSSEVLQQLLDKFAEQKKLNQIQRKRLEEHFINLITESKEFELELTPERIYPEISTTYQFIFTLWDDFLDWKGIVAVQNEMMEIYKTISNVPHSDEQNQEIETMRKRIEELEEFKKHIIETVANKPMPTETKPHEGMYE